jgi:putative flippase GtrA
MTGFNNTKEVGMQRTNVLADAGEWLVDFLPVRLRSIGRQFIKFGMVGAFGAVVDFGTYNLLTRGMGLTAFYIVWGQKISIANNISVFCAIVNNFILNKYWTFRDPRTNLVKQGIYYFIMNTFTWIINQLLMSYLTFNVPLMEQVFGGQRDNAAKAIAIGMILFINFGGSKLLIFRRQK